MSVTAQGTRAASNDAARAAGAPERRFLVALRALSAAQKPGPGVPGYTRWVNRRGARFVAAAAYSWGWTPNVVTAVSAAFTAIGVAVLIAVPASALTGPAVALCFALGYLLDSADGQVARLSGTGSIAGEWLDHVVDAIRTPLLHLAVLIGFVRLHGDGWWPEIVAIAYCVIAVGSFMSSILAEQLSGRVHRDQGGSGVKKSVILLPTDTGTFCWSFAFWGLGSVFPVLYVGLFGINTVHAVIAMRRKYDHLTTLRGAP